MVVFYDGESYWVADGFHRIAAARAVDHEDIRVDVKQGSVRDARLFSAGANAAHGLKRTNADKRRAVAMVLSDDEWRAKSDRWIAQVCGVGNKFVGDVRGQLCPEHSSQPPAPGRRSDHPQAPAAETEPTTEKRMGRDGKARAIRETATARHDIAFRHSSARHLAPLCFGDIDRRSPRRRRGPGSNQGDQAANAAD